MSEFQVVYYQDSAGSAPFKKWFEQLDVMAARKVYEALIRMEIGNFSDSKILTGGIRERRIHSGPGYCLYYGVTRQQCVIMLTGGTKRTQQSDINKAERLWHEYQGKTG